PPRKRVRTTVNRMPRTPPEKYCNCSRWLAPEIASLMELVSLYTEGRLKGKKILALPWDVIRSPSQCINRWKTEMAKSDPHFLASDNDKSQEPFKGRWSEEEDNALQRGVLEYLARKGMAPEPPAHLPDDWDVAGTHPSWCPLDENPAVLVPKSKKNNRGNDIMNDIDTTAWDGAAELFDTLVDNHVYDDPYPEGLEHERSLDRLGTDANKERPQGLPPWKQKRHIQLQPHQDYQHIPFLPSASTSSLSSPSPSSPSSFSSISSSSSQEHPTGQNPTPVHSRQSDTQSDTPVTRQEYMNKVSRLMLHCPWNLITARSIPGRTGIQAQARWSEALDPKVQRGVWSPQEDAQLLRGVERHGRCWIRISDEMVGRTQRQCRTRWVQLSTRKDRIKAATRTKVPKSPKRKQQGNSEGGEGCEDGFEDDYPGLKVLRRREVDVVLGRRFDDGTVI
ncbi:hypothetical protein BGZ94_003281, partial [Podila epigama]